MKSYITLIFIGFKVQRNKGKFTIRLMIPLISYFIIEC